MRRTRLVATERRPDDGGVPSGPPRGHPPIVFTASYEHLDAWHHDDAELRDGRLLVTADTAAPRGVPAHYQAYRDVLLDTCIALVEGGEHSGYGVYVRQRPGPRYVAWAVTPAGGTAIGTVEADRWMPAFERELPNTVPFHHGLERANRFQVVALGTTISFLLNGAFVASMACDPALAEGHLGFWVVRDEGSEAAVAAVDWIQVRGVLPDHHARAAER